LTSIINKIFKHEKRKVYSAFVNFQKAFDLVYRNGFWYKMITYGISCKIIKILQSMYNSAKLCVRASGSLTDYFDSYTGVKQGETISPLLFILFVNDLNDFMVNEAVDVFTLDKLQIFLLLFADDTVFFSYTQEGLQLLLNKLNQYCTEWGLTVYVD
jgi:hypothetical protein